MKHSAVYNSHMIILCACVRLVCICKNQVTCTSWFTIQQTFRHGRHGFLGPWKKGFGVMNLVLLTAKVHRVGCQNLAALVWLLAKWCGYRNQKPDISSLKFTLCTWKWMVESWKMNFLLGWPIFRGYVYCISLWYGITSSKSAHWLNKNTSICHGSFVAFGFPFPFFDNQPPQLVLFCFYITSKTLLISQGFCFATCQPIGARNFDGWTSTTFASRRST